MDDIMTKNKCYIVICSIDLETVCISLLLRLYKQQALRGQSSAV